MKKLTSLLTALCATMLTISTASAQSRVYIHQPAIPVVVARANNIIFDLKVTPRTAGEKITSITINFPTDQLPWIAAVRVFYTGTTSMLGSRSSSSALVHHIGEYGGGQRIFDHPSYATPLASNEHPTAATTLSFEELLFPGTNYLYVSLSLKADTPLETAFSPTISKVTIGQGTAQLIFDEPDGDHPGREKVLRPAVSVRTAGDDSVHSYRIPGLETAKDGTLLAVYDIRNQTNIDLQEDVQVGLSRSIDGGQSWLPMQTIIDMRGYGNLPASQNGVGDPAILVDRATGAIHVMALWNHGMGGNRGWWASRNRAMTPEQQTGQVLIVTSADNGATWSEPRNITSQIKDPLWYLILQGPGRGTTMRDGTLVFPIQWVDSSRMPNASIVSSRDGGKTWKIGVASRSNTTEAQVVELAEDGVLMLNMRDNRGESRAVLTTRDLGLTWEEHPSSRSALREPVCMASLINVPASENALGRDVMLFSNPNTIKGRTHITIKASLDGGLTWLPENQVLLDEELGWGYSCLTMVNPSTVGILYESSVSQLLFQAVPLESIVKKQ